MNASGVDATTGLSTDFLVLFTIDSWREFLRHGAHVMGFNQGKAGLAQKLRPGDRLICYLSKVSAFIAELEVVGASYVDQKPIWSDGLYPVRLPVRVVSDVELERAIPIKRIAASLSFMSAGQTSWSVYVRSSPRRWRAEDALVVRNALLKVSTKTTLAEETFIPLVARVDVKVALFKDGSRVAKVSAKTRELGSEAVRVLGSYEAVISFNKVTGYSVNVPIASTCRPTATCLKTCYFATGAPSWTNSLRHQKSVEATIRADPRAFAQRVALEYDRLGLSFLRWNGGGDLFPESVDAIHHLARMRPDIVLWVVTRIPALATQIQHLPNVFVHFSLDRSSMARKRQFLNGAPKTRNYFFSYQAEPGETVPASVVDDVSVVFFHNYEPTWSGALLERPEVCPLNRASNIAGVCERCRRCFNGNAVTDELDKGTSRSSEVSCDSVALQPSLDSNSTQGSGETLGPSSISPHLKK